MGVGGQRHAPGRFTSVKETLIHCIGCWVGPEAGLDGCGKSHPHQDSIPGPIIYDNKYACVYIVVSILDCNYFPREPTGGTRRSKRSMGLRSGRYRNFIMCQYGDPRGSYFVIYKVWQ